MEKESVHRRRALAVAVGVAALAAATGPTLAGCGGRNPSTTAVAPVLTPSFAESPILFDPLVRPATIGWLPGGMVHNLTRISAGGYELLYLDRESRQPGVLATATVHLQVWPPGLADGQRPGAESSGFSDTAPVNGNPAQWQPVGAQAGALRWEYRARSWAQIHVSGLAGQPLAVARQIAQSVRFDATERVRLPWRLTGLPAGLTVTSLQVIEDNSYQPWRTEIVFHGSNVDPRSHGPWLIVRANKGPGSPDPEDRPRPDTTLHGHPARRQPGSDGSDLIVVYSPNDIIHHVYVAPDGLALLGPDGVAGLAARFELLGEPPTWTDRPLG